MRKLPGISYGIIFSCGVCHGHSSRSEAGWPTQEPLLSFHRLCLSFSWSQCQRRIPAQIVNLMLLLLEWWISTLKQSSPHHTRSQMKGNPWAESSPLCLLAFSQPQSIKQKDIHVALLTAQERENRFGNTLAISSCSLRALNSVNALLVWYFGTYKMVCRFSVEFTKAPSWK